SVPVVRHTGGLADTVRDSDADPGQGTGFVFDQYSGTELLAALNRALAAYQNRPRWQEIIRLGMAQDFSWDASARKYVALYERALEAKGRKG
ncbi:MAG: glycogen synthase, partial [Dehalococcoidia bacterium]|nr:glycogen synthase [Dehalococcoidia bacterium]